MKKYLLVFSFIVVVCSAFFVGCHGDTKKIEATPAEPVKEQYQCPMKCTEQLYDKPGKCPVCDMELVKVTKS
ncbi:MAG: heavy metal-binding domain-containing protein [Bacteroidia bacterium]